MVRRWIMVWGCGVLLRLLLLFIIGLLTFRLLRGVARFLGGGQDRGRRGGGATGPGQGGRATGRGRRFSIPEDNVIDVSYEEVQPLEPDPDPGDEPEAPGDPRGDRDRGGRGEGGADPDGERPWDEAGADPDVGRPRGEGGDDRDARRPRGSRGAAEFSRN